MYFVRDPPSPATCAHQQGGTLPKAVKGGRKRGQGGGIYATLLNWRSMVIDRSKIGRNREIWPRPFLVDSAPIVWPMSAQCCRNWPRPGRCLATFPRIRSRKVDIGPNPVESQPSVGRSLPTLAEVGPTRANSGPRIRRNSAEVDHVRRKFGRIQPAVDRVWSISAGVRPRWKETACIPRLRAALTFRSSRRKGRSQIRVGPKSMPAAHESGMEPMWRPRGGPVAHRCPKP